MKFYYLDIHTGYPQDIYRFYTVFNAKGDHKLLIINT